MRHTASGLFVFLFFSGAILQSQVQPRVSDSRAIANLRITQPEPQVVHHAANLSARLQPTARTWILEQAKAQAERPTVELDALNSAIRGRLSSSRISGASTGFAQQDVDAVVMIVMMQATQDNEDDLKAQMANMQAINQQKATERKLLEDLNSELAKGTQRNLTCGSPVCRSVAAQVASINQTNVSLGHPSRLQAYPNMNYQQLADLQTQLNQNLQSTNDMSEMASMRLQMAMDRRSKLLETLSNIEKKVSDTSSAIVQNMK